MIGLRQHSFSGIVSASARAGGCAAANIRRPLYAEEEEQPRQLVQGGSRQPGRLDRPWPRPGAPVDPDARILLKADQGEDASHQASWPDTKIADALEISRSTVARVRERFAWEGLEAALVHRRDPRPPNPRSSMESRRRI
jgi:hypothetical protein